MPQIQILFKLFKLLLDRMNQAKSMFYAYNVLTILVDLGVEVDTYARPN